MVQSQHRGLESALWFRVSRDDDRVFCWTCICTRTRKPIQAAVCLRDGAVQQAGAGVAVGVPGRRRQERRRQRCGAVAQRLGTQPLLRLRQRSAALSLKTCCWNPSFV